MSIRRPPRIATWLLTHSLPDDHPLVGDILEDFATRPSRGWFWRQSLVAVAEHGPVARASWSSRIGTLLVALTLTGGLALAGRPAQIPVDLPESVRHFTIDEILTSGYSLWGQSSAPFEVVEVTGVIERFSSRRQSNARGFHTTVTLTSRNAPATDDRRFSFSILTTSAPPDLRMGAELTLRCHHDKGRRCEAIPALPRGHQ